MAVGVAVVFRGEIRVFYGLSPMDGSLLMSDGNRVSLLGQRTGFALLPVCCPIPTAVPMLRITDKTDRDLSDFGGWLHHIDTWVNLCGFVEKGGT